MKKNLFIPTASLAPEGIIGGNTSFQTTGPQIAAGHGHSLFLDSTGTVQATGYNNYGQLGDVSPDLR